MGGNLFEWNEHLLRESADVRGLRGGVWALDSSAMASWNRGGNSGSSEGFVTGFRVAGL